MSQSKGMSLMEAVVNTVVGLGVAMVATAAICKAYDIPMTWGNNFIITFWMTVISIVRSYLLRRLFNSNWKARARQCSEGALDFYEKNGRAAPILCRGCARCDERDAARAKFDEESS
jgi:hypothetical protein